MDELDTFKNIKEQYQIPLSVEKIIILWKRYSCDKTWVNISEFHIKSCFKLYFDD